MLRSTLFALLLVGCGDVVSKNLDAALPGDGSDSDAAIDAPDDAPSGPFPSNGSEGAFAPAANVMLTPGVHHFTTIDIPAGVIVTTSGAGTLELRAQGAVVIAGTIDLSGAPGHLADNTLGAGGGATGNPTLQGANGAAGVCATPGPGGQGGNGAGTAACPNLGGASGGGAGGAYQGGSGGGGGGFAGGAGGGNGTNAGGSGASMGGGVGGVGSTTPGVGGQGTGTYAGGAGGTNSLGASGGGGGSIGATAIGDLAVATTFQPGSGGGGGGARVAPPNIPPPNVTVCGGGGGGGGGALRVSSPVSIGIVSGAALHADGGAGGGTVTFPGGGGGGGSGGVIYLAAPAITIAGNVSALGGASGGPSAPGGVGGLGRIRLSVDPAQCTVTGTLAPSFTASCVATAGGGTAERVYVGVYPQ